MDEVVTLCTHVPLGVVVVQESLGSAVQHSTASGWSSLQVPTSSRGQDALLVQNPKPLLKTQENVSHLYHILFVIK